MNLLTVIPVVVETAEQAERLCDCIYWLSGRSREGSCLIVCASDLHPEMVIKVKLAAEVAFSFVEVYHAKPVDARNMLLFQSARHISKVFKLPWLFLEPDCVPLKPDWLKQLAAAYTADPKRYMGPHLKTASDKLVLSRIAVYPPDASRDLDASLDLIPFSTKTRLVQELQYTGDMSTIRDDAVLLHGDKTGALIDQIIEKSSSTVELGTSPAPKNRGGRPPKAKAA